MKEVWKDIKGYEGVYQISNYGNCRSLDRIVIEKNGKKRNTKGRLLKKRISKNGYDAYSLSNKVGKSFYCHRLVAEHFLPYADGLEVNHKDGNKQNNVVDNLEWVTRSENNIHAYRTELRDSKSNRGENNALSKLTDSEVSEMRKLYSNGYTQKELGDMYGVSARVAGYAVTGKTWKHVI